MAGGGSESSAFVRPISRDVRQALRLTSRRIIPVLQLARTTRIPIVICALTLFPLHSIHAKDLFTQNKIAVSIDESIPCGSVMNVRMDAEDEDAYRRSRLDLQSVAKTTKTYLWLDCKKVDKVVFAGYVKGKDKPRYSGEIDKKNGWALEEAAVSEDREEAARLKPKPEDQSKTEPTQQELPAQTADEPAGTGPQTPTANVDPIEEAQKFASLDELQTAAKTSPEARLELAKGYLDLPGRTDDLDIPKNQEAGLAMMEELAAAGNADATHHLGEAYALNKNLKINLPLVEKIIRQPVTGRNREREVVGTMLSTAAMTMGGRAAGAAFFAAGSMGSHSAFNSLGTSYLLDRRTRMPYGRKYLKNRLRVRPNSTGRRFRSSVGMRRIGNVGMGMHFMGLAAGMGSISAAGFLNSVGVSVTSGSSGGNTSGSASQGQAGATPSRADAPGPGGPFTQVIAKHIAELSENGFVERLLELRELEAEGSESQDSASSSGGGRGTGGAGSQSGGSNSRSSNVESQTSGGRNDSSGSDVITPPLIID